VQVSTYGSALIVTRYQSIVGKTEVKLEERNERGGTTPPLRPEGITGEKEGRTASAQHGRKVSQRGLTPGNKMKKQKLEIREKS